MSGMRCLSVVFAFLASAESAWGWIDFNKNGVKDVYEDPERSVGARVADLLARMTVEEKTCQLVTLYGTGRVLKDARPTAGWKNEVWKDGVANIDEELNGVGPASREHPDLIYPFSNHVRAVNAIQRWFVEETRLGIPVDFSNEGIHGLNHTKATPLPAPIGIGSTWNRRLVREAGEIVGAEAKLIGYSNVYAPILDLARDPRWGRVLECYGEDPHLVGELGLAMASGIQSQGVASTLKHYAVYSVPKGGRDGDCRTDPHVTPRELHEIFLRPFRRVVSEARPLGIMCSYNDWNGEPIASSRYFLTELLRKTYGFDGYVVSDSSAVGLLVERHGVAKDFAEACRMVEVAGLNVRTHFTPPADFLVLLRAEIAAGRLPMSVVDQRVSEVLSVKFRLGLFDNPYIGDVERADREAGCMNHLAFSDRIQAESFVLLKNDGTLPLDVAKTKRILVAGPLADETNYMTSRYGPNGLDAVTVLRGLREHLAGRAEVVYAKGCAVTDRNWPDSEIVPTPLEDGERKLLDEAVTAAKDCDVVVAVLGEDELTCGESRTRTSLDLPGRQQMLLERLHAVGKPVVLVLVNGQPLTVNWADRHVAAILEAWFPGARGGVQIARTLFGDENPSGRLSVTIPKCIGQIEYNFPFKKGSHGRQYESGPNGSGKTRVIGPLYPFGYGLSYTTFAYSDLDVTPERGGTGTVWTVSCTVANTGLRKGADVVQLYVRDKVASVVTYDSVLRGFEKVVLAPGERQRIVFKLTSADLAILDKDMKWSVEPGEFEFMVGASSTDIRLKRTVEVSEDEIVCPVGGLPFRDPSVSTAVRVKDLLGRMTVGEKLSQIGKLRAWPNYERSGDSVVFAKGFSREFVAHPVGTVYGVFRCDSWSGRGWEKGVTPEIAAKSRNAFQRLAVEKTRLGIPLFFAEEAPHGLMALGATSFPTGLGLGSSFDKDLLARLGRYVGRDCAVRGVTTPYAPVLDIARDPRWSRIEECFGEDPQLVSLLGLSFVEGLLQSGVQPCLKHFVAGGSSEGGHNAERVHMGGRELFSREIRPFRLAIRAGARHLMSTYHDVDGERCTGSRWLLEDVLRGQLGFRGFVTSDASAIARNWLLRQDESQDFVFAEALRNGCDSDSGAATPAECATGFRKAYEKGLLSDVDLDKAVGRILALKFDMGLFEHPYVDESAVPDRTPQDNSLALEAARKSLVLIKNNGLLPLSADGVSSIAVLGPNADLRPGNQLGDYTAPQKREYVSMVTDGVRQHFPKAVLSYAKGCGIRSRDKSGFAEAVDKAAAAEITVLVLGGSSNSYGDTRRDPLTGATTIDSVKDENNDKESGEGTDRATLALSGVQMELFRAVRARAKKLVVVLIQGRPLEIGEVLEAADAVLLAWYPGCRGGEAIAEALCGKTNPSGRLPVSWPRSSGQLPVCSDSAGESRSDYVDAPGSPLLPFGFGLSYTRFVCSDMSVERRFGGYEVSVAVRNTGTRAGEHSVLFAFTALSSRAQRPWRELADFSRVSLRPGESRRVAGVVTDEVLGSYDRQGLFESPRGSYRFSLIGEEGEALSMTIRHEEGMK